MVSIVFRRQDIFSCFIKVERKPTTYFHFGQITPRSHLCSMGEISLHFLKHEVKKFTANRFSSGYLCWPLEGESSNLHTTRVMKIWYSNDVRKSHKTESLVEEKKKQPTDLEHSSKLNTYIIFIFYVFFFFIFRKTGNK